MRLTVTVAERHGLVRVEADRALDYQPGQVRRAVAAVTQRVVDQIQGHQPIPIAPLVVSDTGQLAQPRDGNDQPPPAPRRGELGSGRGGRRVEVNRGRVLRMLDRGGTVAEAADRFGLDPEQIDRWDDAAADARTDLIAADPGSGR